MNYEHLIIVVGIPLVSALILVYNFVNNRKKDTQIETIKLNNFEHDIDMLKKNFSNEFKTELILNIQKIKQIEYKITKVEESYQHMFDLVEKLDAKNSSEHGKLDTTLEHHTKYLIEISNLVEKLSNKV